MSKVLAFTEMRAKRAMLITVINNAMEILSEIRKQAELEEEIISENLEWVSVLGAAIPMESREYNQKLNLYSRLQKDDES